MVQLIKDKKATAKSAKSQKLSKDDPDFYAKIGRMAGNKLLAEHGKNYFRKIAKLSHPRAEYNGGRPKKSA